MLSRFSKNGTIFFLVLFIMLTGLFFTLPPLGLHSNDEGVKFIQMKNFALHGSLSIPYPAENLGFTAGDMARQPGFLESRGGKLRATTPPLFPFLSSLFYPLFGDRVVHFLPLTFLFVTTILLGMTLGLVMDKGLLYYLLLITFLGSPAFLYIFGFSEITAAFFLEALALYLMVRYFRVRPAPACLFGSSFALGAALLVSPGFIFMAAAWTLAGACLLLAGKKSREAAIFITGAVTAAALWVASEVILYGTFPGPYLESLATGLALSPIRCLVFFGALAFSAALLFTTEKKPSAAFPKSGAWLVAMLIFTGAVFVTSARMSLVPFILLFPALLFVFYGLPARLDEFREGKGPLGMLLVATVLLCLILVSSLRENATYYAFAFYLPVIPVAIAILGLERERIFVAPAVTGLLVLAVVVSIVGGYGEAKMDAMKFTDYNARRVAFLEQSTARGDVVVFTGDPLMEHAGPLFFDRVYLVVRQEGDFERMLKTLKMRGVSRLYLWSDNPSDVARWGNPYDKGSYGTFPMPSSCPYSCNSNFYLVRVDVDAAVIRISKREGKANNAKGVCHAERQIEYKP
jgi:hypothetical protein